MVSSSSASVGAITIKECNLFSLTVEKSFGDGNLISMMGFKGGQDVNNGFFLRQLRN